MKNILLILVVIFLNGCVSAWIDHSSGRFKNVFNKNASVESIRENVGKPEYSYIDGINTDEPQYEIENYHSYDVYDVSGKIHKPGDGAAQATTSAVSLGIAELILIPLTVVKVAGEYMQSHTLVVFYNISGEYITHQLYDDKGKVESISGY